MTKKLPRELIRAMREQLQTSAVEFERRRQDDLLSSMANHHKADSEDEERRRKIREDNEALLKKLQDELCPHEGRESVFFGGYLCHGPCEDCGTDACMEKMPSRTAGG